MYFNLQIYRDAIKLAVYLEDIVKSFDKYHKYTIGKDLRKKSKKLLFLIHRVSFEEDKIKYLKRLVKKCEEMKMIISITKELKAFRSFNQFEHSSKLLVVICKQGQSWYNYYVRVGR